MTQEIKTKTSHGKLRFELLPIKAVEEVVRAFQWGVEVKGYPPFDWMHVKDWRTLYFSATVRHLFDWWKGLDADRESGLHPLAHAAANLLIMITRHNEEEI